jgi:hypothetical protein
MAKDANWGQRKAAHVPDIYGQASLNSRPKTGLDLFEIANKRPGKYIGSISLSRLAQGLRGHI